jgi:hypothetical protein
VRTILCGVGIFFLIIAVLLGILTIVVWPPGGLFFALPFFFLFPAIICGIAGGVLLLLTHLLDGGPAGREKERISAKKSGYTNSVK